MLHPLESDGAAMTTRRASLVLVAFVLATSACSSAAPRAPDPSPTSASRASPSVEAARGAPSRPKHTSAPWSEAVRNHVRKTRASVLLPLDITANGYQILGYPAPDLEEVFAVARAAKQERYEVHGAPLIFDFLRIRHGKSTLYDAQEEFIELASEELEHRRQGGEGHMNAISAFGLRPLSLVGRLLTYEKSWACACGGGPPSSDVSWTSVDLSTREAPSLVQFFEEESLVDALLNDRCVAPLLISLAHRPSSLDEVVSLLGAELPASEDCSGASRAFASFAVLGYDTERDLAGVRLGFPYLTSPGHTKTSYLGLWVRPRETFRGALRDAAMGKGFFLSDER